MSVISWSLSPGHGASSYCGCRRRPLDKEGSCGQPMRNGPPVLEYDEGLKTPYCRKLAKRFTELRIDKCRQRNSMYMAQINVALMGESRGVYTVLVGKPDRKRPLGRPRRRWEDNIKMDLQEVGGGGHGLDGAGSG